MPFRGYARSFSATSARERRPTWGAIAPFYAAFPDLEELRINANEGDLGSLALPKLRSLELVGPIVRLGALGDLRHAEGLVALTLEQGFPEVGLASVLERVRSLPRIERLGLRGWSGERQIASLLAYPRLSQLVALDLSRNGLGAELGLLVQNAHRLAHLEKLDLRFNGFAVSSDLFQELRSRLPRAYVASQ